MRFAAWQTGTAWSLIVWLVLATAAPLVCRRAAPPSCAAATHTCSCRPGTHLVNACCCTDPDPAAAARCQISCDASGTVASFLVPSLPKVILGQRLALRPPAQVVPSPRRPIAPSFYRPVTPPELPPEATA